MKRPFSAIAVIALLATAAVQASSPSAPATPKPDLNKGQAKASEVCMACHSFDGGRGSPAYPILAGQHPEYLLKQLQEFKAGKRKNAVMQGFVAALSDEDMRNVAFFYASKSAKPGFAKNKATVALGEKIYRGGIADRAIPACAACHGPTGAGLPAQYPRIAGQHADYTEAQMLAFRTNGQGAGRANSTQMTGVAAKMNDAEIKAVSDYIAGLR